MTEQSNTAPLPSEADARRDLAAILNWSAHLGLHEGICNHYSALIRREAGDEQPGQAMLINPWGLHWAEIRPEDLVVCHTSDERPPCREDGTPLVEATAFFIHARMHAAAPRARALLHVHTPHATALCCMADGELTMSSQNALRFRGRIKFEPEYGGLALDDGEGSRLATLLGDADVLMLAHHGPVVVGRSIAEAFDDLYYLERAAQLQLLSMRNGQPPLPVPAAAADKTAAQWRTEMPVIAKAHLAAIHRLLGGSMRVPSVPFSTG